MRGRSRGPLPPGADQHVPELDELAAQGLHALDVGVDAAELVAGVVPGCVLVGGHYSLLRSTTRINSSMVVTPRSTSSMGVHAQRPHALLHRLLLEAGVAAPVQDHVADLRRHGQNLVDRLSALVAGLVAIVTSATADQLRTRIVVTSRRRLLRCASRQLQSEILQTPVRFVGLLAPGTDRSHQPLGHGPQQGRGHQERRNADD